MDGEITIGTRLETKNFDKQIEDLERKLERMEHDYSDAVLSGFSEDDEEVRCSFLKKVMNLLKQNRKKN